MPLSEIPLGEWLPSQPSFKNPGCEVADNTIPTPGGYGPLLAPVAQGDTTTEAVQGAWQFDDNTGGSLVVGGSSTRLFTLRSSITETSGYTAIGDGEAWDFARFNDFVFATAPNNAPQYLTDIDSDNTWSAVPGSPPQAKYCAKVGEFLLLGNLASEPNAIQWSPYNDPAGTWGTDRRTQAGKAYMPSQYGAVQRNIGGRYPLVFQESGISRLSYVGPPVVWRADDISQGRGTIAPFSVVNVGYLTYFLAQDGFFVTNGASVEPIGTERVNRWFFDTCNQTNVGRTQGAVDWQNECIAWAFPDDTTAFTRLLVYSWARQRWASGTQAIEWLVSSRQDGISLDALDAIYGDLDSIPLSLDSVEFQAKGRVFAAFKDAEYHTFTGAPLEATWRTGSWQPKPGHGAYVSEVRPHIEEATHDATAALVLTDTFGDNVITPHIGMGNGGFCPVDGEGHKVAVEVKKPAGSLWENATGATVRYTATGSN